MNKWRRRFYRLLSLLIVLSTGLFIAGYFVFGSAWLREKIRQRIVTEVEGATGGRTEVGRFDFNPSSWIFTLDEFTLHGTEGPTEPPLFHARRIEVGLDTASFLNRRVDLKSLTLYEPAFELRIDADGKTNLPTPTRARRAGGNLMADILRLSIDDLEVHDGVFTFEHRRHDFALASRDLELDLQYAAAGPQYDGALRTRSLALRIPGLPLPVGDVATQITLYTDSILIRRVLYDAGYTHLEATGTLEDLRAPHIVMDVAARSDLSLLNVGKGPIDTAGRFTFLAPNDYRYEGDVHGRNLAIRTLAPVVVDGHALFTRDRVTVTGLTALAPEGEFRGQAEIVDFARYSAKGEVRDLSIATVSRLAERPEAAAYSGLLSGPVEVSGSFRGPLAASGDLQIVPTSTALPVEGAVRFNFDQSALRLTLANSYVSTPSSRLEVAGTLNESLRVHATSRRVEDALPAFGLEKLPVSLDNGEASFDGTVTGDLRSPRIAGQVRATRVRYGEYLLDRGEASVVLSSSILELKPFTASALGAEASGSGTLALINWRADEASPFDVRANVRNLPLDRLGRQLPLSGVASGAVTASGSWRNPDLRGNLDIPRPVIEGQQLDRLRLTAHLNGRTIEVDSLEALRGPARLTGSGRGTENGPFTLNATLAGLNLATVPELQKIRQGVAGSVNGTAKLSGRLNGRTPEIAAAELDLALAELTVDKKPIGELTVHGTTRGQEFQFTASGKLSGSALHGEGAYRLVPGYPGHASLELAAVPFGLFDDLRPAAVKAQPWPFTGRLALKASFEGPALDPQHWKAQITVPELSARPARQQRITTNVNAQDFELRNDGPLEFTVDNGVISVRRARLVAKDTNLAASGTFSLAERRPWDLRINGSVNLAGLKTFSPDIQAGGVATLEANVRGQLDEPQLFGRLDLKNASLFVADVPSGLDKVNGRILFDRRRATIDDKLTAETGGGELTLSGFADFSEDETFYRLQAGARSVRVRYPEGLSTVADGTLNLTGSLAQSLLSGTITVQRSGFQPRTDLGSLLAQQSRGGQSSLADNEFLSNMQLDVRVQTAPNTQFTTSLTSDVQADANLSVRGSAARPVVQGRITVNQGDVNFFGNKYTIKRGEVSFYNTTKIEPVLDLDVETRVRAVTVGINFSGPVNKLNISYRSDPPLASNEIIALLTVGRSPDSQSYVSPGSQNNALFQTGANSLLGSAISAPISNQLQRFFGVSRIKIDPLISGLEGTPQARVTVEQQVSKDVTVTFVTTLNRSQQQVVRLEWNLTRQWSVIALRDENGSFGLDFQVRKQVK